MSISVRDLVRIHKGILLQYFSTEQIDVLHEEAETRVLPDSKKTFLNRERIHAVVRPFASSFKHKGVRYLVVVDKDVYTNFATVPRIFHWVVSPTNKYVKKQSIVHDALVDEFGVGEGAVLKKGFLVINTETNGTTQEVSRRFADIVFREMIEEGIEYNWRLNETKAKAKAAVCYAAITVWGIFASFRRLAS